MLGELLKVRPRAKSANTRQKRQLAPRAPTGANERQTPRQKRRHEQAAENVTGDKPSLLDPINVGVGKHKQLQK